MGENVFVAAIFAIIFGLLFYKLTPAFTRQGQKAAVNIESDLKKTSTNELMFSAGGLIVGLVIAYLLTGLYEGINIPILQVVLNIAVVLNMIPTTGITLPFVSYGGTSIAFLMLEMMLALSVSNQIRVKAS